jgi:Na+-translocating ferredoxin:NAD+ oxidoreductase subunit B
MNNKNKVYQDLREHFDKGSAMGYPETKSGVEIRILKRWFTPEEANIATHISLLQYESPERIHKVVTKNGISISIDELKKMLDRMVAKGTLVAHYIGDKERQYKHSGFNPGGIVDLNIFRLTQDMVKEHDEYMAEKFREVEAGDKTGVSQLRTIPVEKSIRPPDKYRQATYDSVRDLIEKAPGPLAIAPCGCRSTRDFSGQHCKYSDKRDWCMQIGSDHARQYIEMGAGRQITKEEAYKILDEAMELGFVLDPGNNQNPKELCICCGDCCGFVGAMKKHPHPIEQSLSNYYSAIDSTKCVGCGLCVKRCMMEARTLVNGKAVVTTERCIGCGNCVAKCTGTASYMVKKEIPKVPVKDRDSLAMLTLSRRKGKWKVLQVKARKMLGLRV